MEKEQNQDMKNDEAKDGPKEEAKVSINKQNNFLKHNKASKISLIKQFKISTISWNALHHKWM